MKIRPLQADKEVEQAIVMLAMCVAERCSNPKPLILHSIKVGLRLREMKQPTEVVVAGFLHDLVEDTNCPLSKIKKEFGQEVSGLVYALTQEKIEDYKERWRTLLGKIKKVGQGAMMIKLIDMRENLIYLPQVKDKQILKETIWKYNFAMEEMKPYIGHLEIFQQCKKECQVVFNKLGFS